MEEELKRLEEFTGFFRSGYTDYPYKKKNRGGYWILYGPMNEKEKIEQSQILAGKGHNIPTEMIWPKEIPEHRYVIQRSIGSKIPKGFAVHHKDRDKTNNSLSNLQLLTATEHRALHSELRKLREVFK